MMVFFQIENFGILTFSCQLFAKFCKTFLIVWHNSIILFIKKWNFALTSLFLTQVIAITVEEEDDIDKFKDYKVSETPVADATSAPEPSLPKEEELISESTKESKTSKSEEVSQGRDRIFSSPLARKLAEDHDVRVSNCCETVSNVWLVFEHRIIIVHYILIIIICA